jgi:alkanesulfonate monooxygenase SsuD/methylene tetrahydromethanopterin reductase-like flavin-dependent oxidoreductase (luciferase family)
MADGPRLGLALNGYGLTVGGHREVLPWHEVLLLGETAEETGYEAIFTPEIRAREAFATLSGFAAATSEVRLGSGVVPIRSRDPLRMAMGAATLQDVSDGRFVLGLGSEEPLEATRRYVETLRRLLGGAGGRDASAGAGEDMDPIDLARLDPVEVPLYLAALGPRMTMLAGEIADGVLLNWCTPERVAEARRQVAEGAGRAGRDPRSVAVAVYVRACLGHDDDRALAVLREAASQYAAMEAYRRQFEAMGLGPQAEEAARGAPGPAAQRLVEAVCVWGGREAALARLGDFAGAGADLVVVYPVAAQDAASSIMGTLLAAAPDPAVEA